jgi:hypothetical protein
MQELSDYIKRPNLRIWTLKKGEDMQVKGIPNIFNKIITEHFLNLEKVLPSPVQEASRTPNRLDQNRTSPQHIIIRTTNTDNRERILQATREKNK